MGYFKTFFLMFSIICLFIFTGYALGGESGLLIALIMGILSNVFAYWYSDKVILSMYKAKLVNQNDSPELIKIVSELTTNADLPTPAIYIIEEDSPNAFATGRNPSNAAIAVTRGLIEKLTQKELKGVVAHELAHILNRDILIATVSAVFAAAISSLASFALIFGGRGGNRSIQPFFIYFACIRYSNCSHNNSNGYFKIKRIRGRQNWGPINTRPWFARFSTRENR